MLRREFMKGVAAALIAANTTLGFRSLSAPEEFYGYGGIELSAMKAQQQLNMIMKILIDAGADKYLDREKFAVHVMAIHGVE